MISKVTKDVVNVITWLFLELVTICNFIVKMSTFKEATKLTFERNKSGKRIESHVVKLLTNFIYQKVSQYKFEIHITSKNL